jgi:hypothetical protein
MKFSKFKLTDEQNIVFVCGASRTGTTLACALLDLRPEINMFSEFIFPLEMEIQELVLWLERDGESNVSSSGEGLDAISSKKIKAFVKRTNISHSRFLKFLRSDKTASLNGTIKGFEGRLWFSVELAKFIFSARSKEDYIGFKLNNSQIFATSEIYPNAKFLILSRDPNAVVSSQVSNNMSQGREHSEKILKNYYGEYFRFAKKYPEKAYSVSLELLSRAPARSIAKFLAKCGIVDLASYEPESIGETDVVKRGHKNSKSIKEGIGIVGSSSDTRSELSQEIQSLFAPTHSLIEPYPIKKYGKSFGKKRKLQKDEYLRIIERAQENRTLLSLRDLNRHCIRNNEEKRVGFVRHDIDHDIDNAVKLAEIDTSLGVSATYCVLHSAPYYGEFNPEQSRYDINDYCIDAIRYIQSLGHEINFHNNLIVMGARHGVNPYTVLENELQQWWDNGVAICGSSTHGDKLCKEFGFRNWELFSECDLKSNGEHFIQMIVCDDKESFRSIVPKRCVSMKAFGLEYEAYDFPKTVYVSDSGGNLREHENVRGHTPKRDLFTNYDIYGVLTHPIWWNLDD